jgi:hypothetical protein
MEGTGVDPGEKAWSKRFQKLMAVSSKSLDVLGG